MPKSYRHSYHENTRKAETLRRRCHWAETSSLHGRKARRPDTQPCHPVEFISEVFHVRNRHGHDFLVTWPQSFADQFATPILLTIGEKDFRVPVNQTIAAWSYVQRKRVPGRLLVFHDANHWIMKGEEARYYWQEVHAWLAKYLSE